MPYIGQIDQHTPTVIQGSCVDSEQEGATLLNICWGDTTLRTIQTDGSRFSFEFDKRFTALLPEGTYLQVRLPDGSFLDRNPSLSTIGEATDGGEKLLGQLKSGYVVDKWGSLKLPFSAKTPEQRSKLAQGMADVTAYFQDRFEKTLFPHYGTLLGYARSKEFIPHDDDTDMSYVSHAETIEDAVNEFYDIMAALKAEGHHIWVVDAGQASVTLKGYNHTGPDVFLSWQKPDGTFFTYFGVLGEIDNHLSFIKDEFEGVTLNIPTNYEQLLQITYGPTWKIPDPDFRWEEPQHLAEMVALFRSAGAARLPSLRGA